MKKSLSTFGLTAALLCATSCASIVSKSNYPITIQSTPSEANISIVNKKGVEVFNGSTPATLKLKSNSGFFSKESYTVIFKKEGYETKKIPLECKLDGWYFGNILFGGFIGLLIVDPATGAMYKLETDFINEALTKTTASVSSQEKGVKLLTLNNIPADWKAHLVPLN